MSKVTYAVAGLVVGFVVGYIATKPKPATCVDNRLILVDMATPLLPDTCVWKNSTEKDRMVWQSRDETPLTVTIPDSSGTTPIPGPGPNPYPNPTCTGTSCSSGALNLSVTSGQKIRYSITLGGQGGGRKIYGHIIIKP